MAKVSLRIYNREIEKLIDQGHTDEAIAHCRHILKSFPKYLETYRLLGKSYIEAKRSGEAVDILGRVLMAVPDDFVSHVGMSINKDDEGKLDDAIWHMERAFESQPSNAAIQGELQRLYGRRDGVEPPKIRMTRGALAHMYVQGELYPQAISEIRAVLSQDAQRADMQILLARAYFRGGQKSDASELCSKLLKRYPYCFDANRILVELQHGNEHAEGAQECRQRVYELDPYAAFTKESIFRSNEVADAAVSLERLDYSGEEVPMSKDWSSSIGIGLSSPTLAAEQPDWLKSGFAEPTPAAVVSASESRETPAPKAESGIPDFLRQAGWTEASGTAQESPPPFDMPTTGELEPAFIPDWLKDQMPAESAIPEKPAETVPAAKPEAPIADQANWLRGLDSSQSAAPAAAPAAAPIPPDWLKGLDSSQSAAPAAAPVPAEDMPDWLSNLGAGEAAQPAPAAEDTLPEWLKEVGGGKSSVSTIDLKPAPPEEPPPVKISAEKPAPPVEQPEPPSPAPPKPVPSASLETLGASAKEQDDAVAWLEMLAAKHGAKPEELVTDPAARSEKAPDWVEQARAMAESEPPAPVVRPGVSAVTEGDKTGVWLRDLAERESQEAPAAALPEEEQKSLLSERENPDWLSGLGDQPAGVVEEKAEIPDWLSELEKQTSVPDQVPPGEPALPEWLGGGRAELTPQAPLPDQSIPEPEAESDLSQRTDIPDWLSGLKSEPVPEAEERNVRASALPEITRDQEESEEFATAHLSGADLPDWLRGLDEPVSAPAPSRDTGSDELPSWLQGDFVEEEPKPERTQPSDWHPAEVEPYAETPQTEFDLDRQGAASLEAAPPPVEVRKPVPRSTAEPRPAPAARPRRDEVLPQVADSVLSQAQEELERGDIPSALDHFGKLIKRGKHLEEIIRDLRESLYRYPVEVGIWQTLGDAYMRANRLQEALDAYNKAEELLR